MRVRNHGRSEKAREDNAMDLSHIRRGSGILWVLRRKPFWNSGKRGEKHKQGEDAVASS